MLQGVPLSILKLPSSYLINPFEKTIAPTAPLPPPTSSNTPTSAHNFNSSFSSNASTHNLSSLQAPIISMPMPCHIYDSSSSSSSGVGSGTGVYAECSSASSISTSSVSPSSNSSAQQSQSSPLEKQLNTAKNRSSYLLTTTNTYATIENATVQMPFPQYNITNENHYNNSNQSLSDGKLNI